MTAPHPKQVLFQGEKSLPVRSACEHFAGVEKRIAKALQIQAERKGDFDVTADCEDGAPAGREVDHMEMVIAQICSPANQYDRLGVRIHSWDHPSWHHDLDQLVPAAGNRLAYVTIPKATAAHQVAEMIETLQRLCFENGIERKIPVHVLIETQGALREVWQIAELPWIEVIDFGLMDFVSGHQGAIPTSAMRTPGQFEHRLVARAKAEVAAAALANGLVPAHNVTLDIQDPSTALGDARRAREEFGYLRMWSIHPSQIDPILAAMKPDFAGVAAAGAILCAAQDADWGPIQFDGDLHDRATYRDCWRLLEAAHLYGVEIDRESKRRFFGEGEPD